MLLVKQINIWCHFAMRALGNLSHRSFFELALDLLSLWDMEEAFSCQSLVSGGISDATGGLVQCSYSWQEKGRVGCFFLKKAPHLTVKRRFY